MSLILSEDAAPACVRELGKFDKNIYRISQLLTLYLQEFLDACNSVT